MTAANTTLKINVDTSKLLGVNSLGVKVGLKGPAASSIGTAVGNKRASAK